jgi:hypothetical protein
MNKKEKPQVGNQARKQSSKEMRRNYIDAKKED